MLCHCTPEVVDLYDSRGLNLSHDGSDCPLLSFGVLCMLVAQLHEEQLEPLELLDARLPVVGLDITQGASDGRRLLLDLSWNHAGVEPS